MAKRIVYYQFLNSFTYCLLLFLKAKKFPNFLKIKVYHPKNAL